VNTGQQGAANTQRAYAGDWRRFTTWCREHGRESLPADVPTMAAFVTSLAESGKKVATIQRHCASVSKAHQLAGLPTPTDDRQFKTLIEGISREKGVKRRPLHWRTSSAWCRVLIRHDQMGCATGPYCYSDWPEHFAATSSPA
jgi:hypothetical protein